MNSDYIPQQHSDFGYLLPPCATPRTAVAVCNTQEGIIQHSSDAGYLGSSDVSCNGSNSECNSDSTQTDEYSMYIFPDAYDPDNPSPAAVCNREQIVTEQYRGEYGPVDLSPNAPYVLEPTEQIPDRYDPEVLSSTAIYNLGQNLYNPYPHGYDPAYLSYNAVRNPELRITKQMPHRNDPGDSSAFYNHGQKLSNQYPVYLNPSVTFGPVQSISKQFHYTLHSADLSAVHDLRQSAPTQYSDGAYYTGHSESQTCPEPVVVDNPDVIHSLGHSSSQYIPAGAIPIVAVPNSFSSVFSNNAIHDASPSSSGDGPQSPTQHRCSCRLACDVCRATPAFHVFAEPVASQSHHLQSSSNRKRRSTSSGFKAGRKLACLKEKDRLKLINSAFQKLKNAVPFAYRRHQKMSKLKVLRYAIQHIQDMANALAGTP